MAKSKLTKRAALATIRDYRASGESLASIHRRYESMGHSAMISSEREATKRGRWYFLVARLAREQMDVQR